MCYQKPTVHKAPDKGGAYSETMDSKPHVSEPQPFYKLPNNEVKTMRTE